AIASNTSGPGSDGVTGLRCNSDARAATASGRTDKSTSPETAAPLLFACLRSQALDSSIARVTVDLNSAISAGWSRSRASALADDKRLDFPQRLPKPECRY